MAMRKLSVLAVLVSLMLLAGVTVFAQEKPPAEPAPPPAAEPAPPADKPAPPAAEPAPPAAKPAPPAAAPAPPAATAPAAPVVKEIKIVVDNKAKTNGEVRFAFTPAGGTAKEIRVTVVKGMSKRDICRDIAKELTVAVGANYKVDHYDDDKVKVAGKEEATFSLTIAGQTVSGVSITLK
jgi:3-oxoacyl-ACP reductase-like protein